MRFAYFYFMKQESDRVRAAAPGHISYWERLALANYRGGPFADLSGGLIVFDTESTEDAERLVSDDPFLREGLLERHWVKQWLDKPHGGGEAASHPRSGATDRGENALKRGHPSGDDGGVAGEEETEQ